MMGHWVRALGLEFCGIGYGHFWDMMGFLGLGVLELRLLRLFLYILPRRDVLGNFWSLGMGLAWNGILAFPWESADFHFVCCCLIGREGEMDGWCI
jgi:hypothetical protein